MNGRKTNTEKNYRFIVSLHDKRKNCAIRSNRDFICLLAKSLN